MTDDNTNKYPGSNFSVSTFDDLLSDNTWIIGGVSIIYPGVHVYVDDESKVYKLTQEPYSTSSNWEEVPIEDGPDLSDYYTKEETNAAIATAIGDALGGSY